MASVDVSALSKQQKDELAVSYAAMLLHDGELEITVSVFPLDRVFLIPRTGEIRVLKHSNLTDSRRRRRSTRFFQLPASPSKATTQLFS